MPKNVFKMEFELTTRNQYTKLDCEIQMAVNGRELPTMAILGAAMEEAITLIQERVTESYKVVPPRAVDAPSVSSVSSVSPVSPVAKADPVAVAEVAAARNPVTAVDAAVKLAETLDEEPMPAKPTADGGSRFS